MEVKRESATPGDIDKDLVALTQFVRAAGYQRAIYLVFGEHAERTIGRIWRAAERANGLARIELWVHTSAGESARHVATLLAKEPQRSGSVGAKVASRRRSQPKTQPVIPR